MFTIVIVTMRNVRQFMQKAKKRCATSNAARANHYFSWYSNAGIADLTHQCSVFHEKLEKVFENEWKVKHCLAQDTILKKKTNELKE